MTENFSSIDKTSDLESEIAELESRIESRRRELETMEGVVSETEETVKDTIKSSLEDHGLSKQKTTRDDGGVVLDEEDKKQVEGFVEVMRNSGIKNAVRKIVNQPAHIVDAFHDFLVDYLYEELVKRGIVK